MAVDHSDEYKVKKRGGCYCCCRGYFWYHLVMIIVLAVGMIFNLYLYDKNKDAKCKSTNTAGTVLKESNPWTTLILINGLCYLFMF